MTMTALWQSVAMTRNSDLENLRPYRRYLSIPIHCLDRYTILLSAKPYRSPTLTTNLFTPCNIELMTLPSTTYQSSWWRPQPHHPLHSGTWNKQPLDPACTAIVHPWGNIMTSSVQTISRRLELYEVPYHLIDSWKIGLGPQWHKIPIIWIRSDLLRRQANGKRWHWQHTDYQFNDLTDNAICWYYRWLQLWTQVWYQSWSHL